MKRFLLLVIASTLLLGLNSCKTRRNGRNTRVTANIDKEGLIAKNRESAIRFDFLSIKGKADYENSSDGTTVGFTYKANIARDSLIWVSLTKFGFPLAMILADPDTIRIRRMDTKEVNICDYQILTKIAGMQVDFDLLQEIFTGQPRLDPAQLSYEKVSQKDLKLSGKRSHFDVDWFFDSSNFKLVRMDLEDAVMGMESSLIYGNFLEVESQLVPSVVTLEVKSPSGVKVTMEHNKIELDNPETTFSFKIPKSYAVTGCKL